MMIATRGGSGVRPRVGLVRVFPVARTSVMASDGPESRIRLPESVEELGPGSPAEDRCGTTDIEQARSDVARSGGGAGRLGGVAGDRRQGHEQLVDRRRPTGADVQDVRRAGIE